MSREDGKIGGIEALTGYYEDLVRKVRRDHFNESHCVCLGVVIQG